MSDNDQQTDYGAYKYCIALIQVLAYGNGLYSSLQLLDCIYDFRSIIRVVWFIKIYFFKNIFIFSNVCFTKNNESIKKNFDQLKIE